MRDDLLELLVDLGGVAPGDNDGLSAYGAFVGCIEMLGEAWFHAEVGAAARKHCRVLQGVLAETAVQNDEGCTLL